MALCPITLSLQDTMMQQEENLLRRIEQQEMVAKQFGFYWERLDQLIDQIQSECAEIEEAWEKKDLSHLQEEVGDFLQAAVSLAIFCRLDPQETLLLSIEKFQRRYDKLVALAHQEGLESLKGKPFDLLLDFWKRAKQNPD
jgi:uncharacterized protein YabN with tetrapyrrole methylase and pyrophosphatase domain